MFLFPLHPTTTVVRDFSKSGSFRTLNVCNSRNSIGSVWMKSNPVLKTETAFTEAQTQESLKTQETNNTEKKLVALKTKTRALWFLQSQSHEVNHRIRQQNRIYC